MKTIITAISTLALASFALAGCAAGTAPVADNEATSGARAAVTVSLAGAAEASAEAALDADEVSALVEALERHQDAELAPAAAGSAWMTVELVVDGGETLRAAVQIPTPADPQDAVEQGLGALLQSGGPSSFSPNQPAPSEGGDGCLGILDNCLRAGDTYGRCCFQYCLCTGGGVISCALFC
jgi:hypothetical protein